MNPGGAVIDYKGVPPNLDRIISGAPLGEIDKAIAQIEEYIRWLPSQGYNALNEPQYYLYQALLNRRSQLRGGGTLIDPDYALYLESRPGFFDRSDQWLIPPGALSETYLGWALRDIVLGEEHFTLTGLAGDSLNVALLGKVIGRVLNFSVGGRNLNSGGDVIPPGQTGAPWLAGWQAGGLVPITSAIAEGVGGVGGGPAGVGLNPQPSPCHLPSVQQRRG